jgi:hypothetical protein
MTPIAVEEMACDLSYASETLIDSADTAAAVAPENFLPPDDLDVLETGAIAGREDQPRLPPRGFVAGRRSWRPSDF